MKKFLFLIALFTLMGGVNSVKAGNHYLEITTNEAKKNAWDWQFWYQLETPLETSTTYVLTMDAKCSQDFHLDFWPHESTSSKCIYTGFDINTEWRSYRCEFSTGECAADRVRWCFGTLKGKICIDNVKLVKKGESTDLLSGGDFESALDAHWSALSGVSYSIYGTTSTLTRCFKMVNSTAKTNVYEAAVKYNLDEPLVKDKTYVLTMRVKATEAFYLAFWPAQSGGTTTYTGYNIGTDWADCSCTFTAKDNHTFLQWCIGDRACTVWFDNIKLVEQGETTDLINDGSFEGELVSNWGDFGYHKPDYYGLEITYPAVEAVVPFPEVQLTKSMFKTWNGVGKDAEVVSNNPYWNAEDYETEGSSGTCYYGSGNVSYLDYADISDYSALKIYGTGSNLRVMFNRQTDKGALTEVQVTPSVDGTLLDLTSYEFVHLNAIKVVNGGGATTVTNITLIDSSVDSSVDYILSGDIKDGSFSSSATSALADASATFYNTLGVTGSGVKLNATNKNALFKANSGVLSNTNVIVSGNCANLELTDGNYPFKAPSTFTASSVSYNRTFTVGKASTVCLPFELSKEEAHTAGTFYTLTAYEGGTLTFTEIGENDGTEAYKPYLFKAASGTPFSSAYANKEIAETPATLTGTTVEGYTLTGVLTGSTDVAADHAGETVYGWSANSGEEEGKFVQVGTGVSIDPFRAYVVYNGSGNNARLAARFVGGSVTGIDEVSEAQGFNNFEGKVFENGKIVIYKKGMKFNANGARLK